ncbi:hypothetical protein N9924_01245 [bacterium]|nr:hypothetical protein [bacterium]
MEELKRKASPLYKELGELEAVVKESNNTLIELMGEVVIESRIHTVLLDRLCALKESQQESDDAKHARNTRLNLLVLILAGTAFYLEWIKIDADIMNALMGLLQWDY